MPNITTDVKTGTIDATAPTATALPEPKPVGMTTKSFGNATLHSDKVVGPGEAVTQIQDDEDGPIVAAPLMQPGFGNYHIKNPNISLRWIFTGGKNQKRVQDALAQGFEFATPSDVDIPGLGPVDGRFVNGDLILMKHSRRKYLGAIKYNEEHSQSLVTSKNYKGVGQSELSKALTGVNGARAALMPRQGMSPKLVVESPNLSEIPTFETGATR